MTTFFDPTPVDTTLTDAALPLKGRAWRWVWSGVTDADSGARARKIVQTNVGVMVLMLTMLGYLVLFAVLFEPQVVKPVIWQTVWVSFSPLVWWLNAKRQLRAARWLTVVLAVGCVWLVIAAGQGTVMSTHLYFVLFALLSPTIFEASEWRSTVVVAVVCLALYGYYAWGNPTHAAAMDAISPEARQFTQRVVTVLCAATLLLMVLLTEASSADAERRLLRQALTDQLTNMPNRRHFVRRFEQERARAARQGQPMCVAVLDLDRFKAVNDKLGHEAGDEALRHVARVLKRHARPYDGLARLGGEEFGWLLPGATPAHAVQAAERLRQLIEDTPMHYGSRALPLTASIGVADVRPAADISAALARADKALYAAKAGGRNQVRLAA